MLKCSRCQSENPDDAQFCDSCGSRLSASAAGLTAASTTCPSCGRPTPVDAEFCAGCGKTLGVEYASFWRRFGGYLIDAVIVIVGQLIVGFMIGIILASSGEQGAESVSFLFYWGISIVVSIAYVVPLNANGGTLGKKAVGIRLEDAVTGENIGISLAFVRYLVSIASYLAILLGYLWCIWGDKKQTWHDKAAGSVVVRA